MYERILISSQINFSIHKDGAISPAITLMGPDVQKKTAAKSLDFIPIALTKTTSEVQASGDSKVTEGDGKKSAHQANVYSKKLKELKDQMDDDVSSSSSLFCLSSNMNVIQCNKSITCDRVHKKEQL